LGSGGTFVNGTPDYGRVRWPSQRGICGTLFVLARQFGADLTSVGVTGTWAEREDGAAVVEDGQCLPPGGAGRGLVTAGIESVAEMAEYCGQVITAANFSVRGDSLLVVVT
jgi:hypothetical protein